VVGGQTSGPGGRKSPSGVQGQSPGMGPGVDVPQKLKQNVKVAYKFQRFPVHKFRILWVQKQSLDSIFANTRFKNILKIQ